MTRILHIGKYYPPFHGGIENFMAALLPEQQRRGHEVAALVHGHRFGGRFASEVIDGVSIHRAPSWGRLLFTPLSPGFGRQLRRVIREFRPELLHIHMPNVSAFHLLRLRECRDIPWLIHWHADVVASPLHRGLAFAYRFYRPFEQRLLARAQGVVATSPPYLESSDALRPWRDKCHVVPLGLPDTPAQGSRQGSGASVPAHSGPSSEPLILCIGRLTYYKGQQVLIDAATALPEAQIVLVGQGEQEGRLARQIEQMGLRHHVLMAGALPRDELASLLARCHCLCLPSLERTEAFGMVLLEAMRAGKAVVASDVPGAGMGYVVKHEETGLLVPPGDSAALGRALRRLLDEPALCRDMGRAGRERFLAEFEIGRAAGSLDALYNRYSGVSASVSSI